MTTYPEILAQYVKDWTDRAYLVRDIMRHNNGRYYPKDITYFMEYRNFVDHSLVYDHGIYRFKPPRILRGLYTHNIEHLKKLINDMITLEQNLYKSGGLNEVELNHMLDIKSLIHWVLKKKYKDMPNGLRKKILAGDYKDKTHFTVEKSK